MTAELTAAIDYLDRGVSILPLVPGSKRSMGRWRPWTQSRMAPETARAWWDGRAGIRVGLGVITGAVSNSLAVLDIEPEHVATVLRARVLPDTPVVTTARGGLHVYCRGETRSGKLRLDGKTVGDIRGHGGYVVAPPSCIGNGSYVWHGPQRWAVGDLAEIPAWTQARSIRAVRGAEGWAGATASGQFTGGASVTSAHPSVPLVKRLPAKARWAALCPQPRPSLSELDFWIASECVFAGADYDEVEDLFADLPIGDHVAERAARGDFDYLARVYAGALDFVMRELSTAVTVKCASVILDGGGCDLFAADRPGSTRRATIDLHPRGSSQLWRYRIPYELGWPHTGERSGEWLQFLAAFGCDPALDFAVPHGRLGKAIVRDGRVLRLLDRSLTP